MQVNVWPKKRKHRKLSVVLWNEPEKRSLWLSAGFDCLGVVSKYACGRAFMTWFAYNAKSDCHVALFSDSLGGPLLAEITAADERQVALWVIRRGGQVMVEGVGAADREFFRFAGP